MENADIENLLDIQVITEDGGTAKKLNIDKEPSRVEHVTLT